MAHPALTLAVAVLAAAFFARPALAATALAAAVNNSSTAVGASGSFDVDLANTGSSAGVSNFTITVSVPANSGITLESATNHTSALTGAYIFSSLGSPTFTPSPVVSDSMTITGMAGPPGVGLVGATPVGLANISYSVGSQAAPGPVSVTLTTLVEDLNGGSIPTSVQNGTINLTPAPEPQAWSLMIIPVIGLLVRRREKGRGQSSLS